MFITPYAANLEKEAYIEVEHEGIKSAFVVTEIDVISTSGVMYVSVDPTYIHDKTDKPI
jgi:hypothetical protein